MKKLYVLGAVLLLSSSLFAMGNMKSGTNNNCGDKAKTCSCSTTTNNNCNCCCCGSTTNCNSTTTTGSAIKK